MSRLGPGDTLRILLIAESESLRDQIGLILSQFAGDHRLFWVAQPEIAAKRAEDLLPHLILVDDNLMGTSAPIVIKQLVATAPGAVVLIMVDENGMSVARQSVLSGARGFVVKPLVAEEFWATIYQLLVESQTATREPRQNPAATGKVMVFLGPKGGTGRTTVAVNTAIAMHKQSRKSVVVVDADFSAPALDVMLNLEGDKDISLLLSRVSRLDHDLMSSVLVSHSSGIRVLLAPPPSYTSMDMTQPQVEQIVAHLRSMFDWVIVDLGLPLGESGLAFLDGADRIVMTLLPEMVCLRSTRLTLNLLNARGCADDKVWPVLNRGTMVGGVTRRDIEERLHVRIRHMVPDDQPLVSLSVNRGVPLILSHPQSAVGRSIFALAEQFASEEGEQGAVPNRLHAGAALLGRMLRRTGSARA